MASAITVDLGTKRLCIAEASIDNKLVFEYFARLPARERERVFGRALHIGVLALMEDRLEAFFMRTRDELGVHLESLKLIFETQRRDFLKTAAKGRAAEIQVLDALRGWFAARELPDRAVPAGAAAGRLPRNRTGDIVCSVNGSDAKRIVVEVKFDKSRKLGDVAHYELRSQKRDTAWSQLLEARVNRDAQGSIIVFDRSLLDESVLARAEHVAYIPAVGFVAVVDSRRGDYTNLFIAYSLMRDIVLHARPAALDKDVLAILVTRIIKDLRTACAVRTMVEDNIANCRKILATLNQSLASVEASEKYLAKLLTAGRLSREDLLAFYAGDEVRERFQDIEKDLHKRTGAPKDPATEEGAETVQRKRSAT